MERQDSPRMHVAHHELESVAIIINNNPWHILRTMGARESMPINTQYMPSDCQATSLSTTGGVQQRTSSSDAQAQAPAPQHTHLPQPLCLQQAAASLLQLGSRAFWLCWGCPLTMGCSLPTVGGQPTVQHQSCQGLWPDGQQQTAARQRPKGARCRLPQLQPGPVFPPR